MLSISEKTNVGPKPLTPPCVRTTGSDRVLVLDDGRVAEYDAPEALMQRPDSLFRVLLKEMNEQNKKGK